MLRHPFGDEPRAPLPDESPHTATAERPAREVRRSEPKSPPESPPAEHVADKPAETQAPTHAEIRAIILGLLLAMFLAALNQTIVATALPTIGREFDDFENLSWIVTAYLLTSTAVAPLYGKLVGRPRPPLHDADRDRHLHRRLGLCALAPNMMMLVLGRGLQGLGGGGILPIAQSIIADIIAPRVRGRYQVYMGTVWVERGRGRPGARRRRVRAPALVAGVLDQPADRARRRVDDASPPAAACRATAPAQARPARRRPDDGRRDSAAARAHLGRRALPWASPVILGLLAASGVLVAGVHLAPLHAPEPFLPIPVMANPIMRWGTASTSFAMGTSIGLTIFVPLYYRGGAQALGDAIRASP